MSFNKTLITQPKYLCVAFIFLFISTNSFAQNVEHENGPGISERAKYELNRIKDPKLGKVPENAQWQALMETKQVSEFYLNTPSRTTALSWVERGPNSDVVGSSNGNTRANSGVTSGRIRTILVDASDTSGKTVWIGGVDGGIWKTTDITASPSPWTVVNDYLSNLSVSDICQNPLNKSIMYFCTGESYYNSDAVAGVGVFKSSDNGVTWSLLSSTTSYTQCTRIVCDNSGNVYLATRGYGLLRSTDGGTSWTGITPTGMSTSICDLEYSSTGRLHVVAGIFSTQSYRYTDIAATVSSASGWSAPATAFPSYSMRAEIASSGNVLYALPANGSYQVPTIYKSTDGGANWTATASQPAAGGWANGQGWYSLSLAIDPSNSNNCIVGGLDNYMTTNGGSSWTQISYWVGTTGQYVHADQHDAVWYKNGSRLLFASDGGIFYSADKGTTIRDRNTGLRLKQFYSVAIHPTANTNYFLAGAQDNGVHKLTSSGLGASVEVTGGDGAFVAIDKDQPQYQFGSYVYNNYRRSTDGGNTWSSINFSNNGQFINPYDYDDLNNKIYASNTAGTYLRWDNPQTGSTTSAISVANFNAAIVSAVHVSPYISNRVYFGTTGGRIVKVNNANLASPTSANITGTSMPSGANISCINNGSSDKYLIASYSNYGVTNVWFSTDSGATWTGVDGNLPNMPVNWCMFEPNDDTRAIIATETGVWETTLLDGASTSWIPSLNFPKVRTVMLQYRSSDGTLVAATHGRGLFSTIIDQSTTCSTPSGLTSASITSSSATIGWSAVSGAISYNADYRKNGDTTWINAANATSSTSVNLTGLLSSTLYEWRVNTNCSNGSSTYTPAQFTTSAPPSCNAPSGLAASTITSSGATVSWTGVSGALSYAIDYKLTSTSSWTSAASANTGTSYALSGLASSTTYDYRVRTNCSSGNSSYSQSQFTTSTVSNCPGPLDVSTNGSASGAATIPFNTDIKGLINTGSDNDYYKFVITNGGTATITLSTLPADYDLKLIGSNGSSTIATSANGGTTSETISRTFSTGTYYLRVYPYQNAFNTSSCYTLRIQLGTASQPDLLIPMNNENTVVKLYPNPANNTLNISTNKVLDENSVLIIYSVTGVELIHQPFQINPQSIDLSGLKPGIYLIRARTSEGDASYKFIKQ